MLEYAYICYNLHITIYTNTYIANGKKLSKNTNKSNLNKFEFLEKKKIV